MLIDIHAHKYAATKDKTPHPDQSSLVEVLQKGKPYSFEHPRTLKITHCIGEMVAVDGELFRIVEHTGSTTTV